jgi:hypothetical protein
MSQTQISQAPSGEGKIPAKEKEFLVWQKDTWGSFGQHYNIYTFVIDIEKKQQVPIFQLVTVRHEKNDSRKNIHRFTYVSQSEMKKLSGKILKIVEDYKSSGKHVITVKYKIVTETGDLADLKYETGLRDYSGFYDIVYLPNSKKLVVRKEEVEVQ